MYYFIGISIVFTFIYRFVFKNDLVNASVTTLSVTFLSFLNYYFTDSLVGMWPIAIIVQSMVVLVSSITTLLAISAFMKFRSNKNTQN